jgi:UDP-N-acetylglucosamine 2-epimerase (non-hydrolysing)
VILGTRPEAIKLAGVVRALGDRARLIHTGQHFDRRMWSDVAAALGLPAPEESFSIGGTHRGEQIGEATTVLTRHLLARPAAAVVVQGDTNSTLAGALAGTATGTPVVHVEAGLRSNDRGMPEEINRLLVDRVADLCCAPLERNAEILRAEGVPPQAIAVTGNTLADVATGLLPPPDRTAATLAAHGLVPDGYVLATVHRPSNVDDPQRLAAVLAALGAAAHDVPVLFPVHPRTRARILAAGLTVPAGVLAVEPVDPATFLSLLSRARLAVSDSGGVQEEACLFRRPLLVLRDTTERPELLDGWCRLVGDGDPAGAISTAVRDAVDWGRLLSERDLPYPIGPAGPRIVAALDSLLDRR